MPRTKEPSENPRINVPVPRAIRARASKKAKDEGKTMAQVVTRLLRDYAAPQKKLAA